jgi:hypothetical protein
MAIQQGATPGRRSSETSLSISRTQAIDWDGKTLSGWVNLDGTPTKVSTDRETIHSQAPGFSDALNREIGRHRDEIFEKLLPFFKRQSEISSTVDCVARDDCRPVCFCKRPTNL